MAWWTSSRRRLGEFAALQGWERRTVVAAVVLNAGFALSLSRRGFGRTEAVARRLARRSVRHATGTPERIGELVAHCAALTRTTCVPRSLTLATLLGRCGWPAEIRFGVAEGDGPGGVAAHAWVEVLGRPVAEAPDVLARYGPLVALRSDPLGAGHAH